MKIQIATVALTVLIALSSPAGELNPPGIPSPTVNPAESRTPLTALPVTIEESGSYYFTTSLAVSGDGNGIVLDADHVTIDLNGFSLIGDSGASSGTGISRANQFTNIRNITIRNGVIRDWADSGVDFELFSNQVLIEDLHVANCGSHGLYLGNDSIVRTTTVEDCGGSGILVNINSTIVECSARDNGENGIRTGDASVVQSCVARDNGDNGISADGSILDCSTSDNANAGIRSGSGSLVSHCSSEGNDVGILGNGRTEVIDCQVAASDTTGIELTTRGTVRGCDVAISNVIANIDGIICVDDSLISNNRVRGHVNGSGIVVSGDHNRIEGNSLVGNDTGIQIVGANNLIVRNSYTDNNTTHTVPLNPNSIAPIVTSANIGTDDNPHSNYSH